MRLGYRTRRSKVPVAEAKPQPGIENVRGYEQAPHPKHGTFVRFSYIDIEQWWRRTDRGVAMHCRHGANPASGSRRAVRCKSQRRAGAGTLGVVTCLDDLRLSRRNSTDSSSSIGPRRRNPISEDSMHKRYPRSSNRIRYPVRRSGPRRPTDSAGPSDGVAQTCLERSLEQNPSARAIA